ncbi:MAG: hypothetical protein PUP91_21990 [Rhizonema sp. PD37]|nr:hypothetical protein [Rhizonema sp. PD37]
MSVKKNYYEICLTSCCDRLAAIALLKQHRPYLEMIPSLRRPDESLITIPLPIIRFRGDIAKPAQATLLPCELGILMCDPEWKIKTGSEIIVFIHRPHEDFSDLLGRWRQTQVWLDKEYEWLMPPRYTHLLSEGTNNIYPLFIVFPETPERILRGFVGADLPFIIQTPDLQDEKMLETFSSDAPL